MNKIVTLVLVSSIFMPELSARPTLKDVRDTMTLRNGFRTAGGLAGGLTGHLAGHLAGDLARYIATSNTNFNASTTELLIAYSVHIFIVTDFIAGSIYGARVSEAVYDFFANKVSSKQKNCD